MSRSQPWALQDIARCLALVQHQDRNIALAAALSESDLPQLGRCSFLGSTVGCLLCQSYRQRISLLDNTHWGHRNSNVEFHKRQSSSTEVATTLKRGHSVVNNIADRWPQPVADDSHLLDRRAGVVASSPAQSLSPRVSLPHHRPGVRSSRTPPNIVC